jgi:hypothetical protein
MTTLHMHHIHYYSIYSIKVNNINIKHKTQAFVNSQLRKGCRFRKQSGSQATPPAVYTCTTCGEGFGRKSNLNKHIHVKHGGPKPVRFVDNEENLSAKPFKCDFCPRGLKTRKLLRKHLIREHPDKTGKKWKCGAEGCDKVGYRLYSRTEFESGVKTVKYELRYH